MFSSPVKMIDPLIPDWEKALDSAVFDPVEGVQRVTLIDGASSRLCVVSLAPYQKISPHLHSKGQEFYYILQGKCRVLTGEVRGETISPLFSIPIQKGESFGIPERMAHEIQNTGPEDLVFLLVSPHENFSEDRKSLPSFPQIELDPFFHSLSSETH